MKIVVNHLTRMKPGYICVAGIDQSSGKHVRPVIAYSRITEDLLKRNGGPFDIAAAVDLGTVHARHSPPEVEDHVFDPRHAKAKAVLGPDKFWQLLQATSEPTLIDIFGTSLKSNGRSMAVDRGEGTASLGCWASGSPPVIEVDGYNKVKLRVQDEGRSLYVGVTDVRLHDGDQPKSKVITDLNRRLRAGVSCILSVGLSRAFIKKGDTEERHFLQVNNIHLEDDPTWTG
jgi:hypothetical protein